MKQTIFLMLLMLNISAVFGQVIRQPEDFVSWNWTRIDGEIPLGEEVEVSEGKIPYSMEIQYRLRNQAQDFHQLILRPMLGYKLDQNTTLWLGYTYIYQDLRGERVHEHRSFQMITYGTKIKGTPIVFLGNTRLEQRIIDNPEELNHRLRQMIRVSFGLFKIKEHKLSIYFQDEVFIRLNTTGWAGQRGYDQNRFMVGLEYSTKINITPVSFNVGYLNLHTPTRTIHGVSAGVRITIPSSKKKKQPKNFFENEDEAFRPDW